MCFPPELGRTFIPAFPGIEFRGWVEGDVSSRLEFWVWASTSMHRDVLVSHCGVGGERVSPYQISIGGAGLCVPSSPGDRTTSGMSCGFRPPPFHFFDYELKTCHNTVCFWGRLCCVCFACLSCVCGLRLSDRSTVGQLCLSVHRVPQ